MRTEWLKEEMRAFVEDRQWEKWHTPKNITCALSVEVAELLEHFMWSLDDGRETYRQNREAIGEEIADCFCYLVRLCDVLDVDIQEVIEKKMKKNKLKYPSHEVRGNFVKRNTVQQNHNMVMNYES